MSSYLSATAVGLNIFQLFLLPLALLPHGAHWGWVLIPLALLNNSFWSLLHDAIHGTLLADRTTNDRAGRVMAILYGAPLGLLRAGHLLHHRYSRTRRERAEVYDPAATTWWKAAPAYYARLFGGLYLAEAASVVLALLPRPALLALARRTDSSDSVAGLVCERIGRDGTAAAFRADAVAVVAVYVSAFAAYGEHGWMLVAALALRAFLISVADNSYHYGTRLDAPDGALNLRLPRPLECLLLNFSLHGTHHGQPGVRWSGLRERFEAGGSRYDLGWFAAVARQFRGPLRADRL